MSPPALAVRGLTVDYPTGTELVHAVRGIDLELAPGGSLGVIGESGSGKTSLALSCLMLLPEGTRVGGSVTVFGQELVGASPKTLRAVRWRTVACALQSPGRGLNPVRKVGSQIRETMRLRGGLGRQAARRRAAELAEQVELEPSLLEGYAHQMSGGQVQRAMLALALSCDPRVLILDEPTAGLDATTKHELLGTLKRLQSDRDLAVLFVSHDIPFVARFSDDLAVLYAGMVMEHGPVGAVLAEPLHPYTRDLLGALPTMTTQKDLRGIRGDAPDPSEPPSGCPYHPRCTQALEECATWAPERLPIAGRDVVCVREGIITRLAASGLHKSFRPSRHRRVEALRDVAVTVRAGEAVGVVGESGSGKTTLARVLLGLLPPDQGTVSWEGRDTARFDAGDWREFRRSTAIVYQDPYEAVSHRLTVAQATREPLDVQRLGSSSERGQRVRELLARVGLPTTDRFLRRRTHELSGGQLQRLAIARALILSPRLLIADEPTSMLDASEQAKVLALLKDLQVERGMSMAFVSHDLALVRKVVDRLLVLHAGRAVEEGPGHRVVAAPESAEAARLVRAAPTLAAIPAEVSGPDWWTSSSRRPEAVDKKEHA